MQAKLTETYITNLKHKSVRYDVRDTIERGLVLRVGKKFGSKQWHTFVYRGAKRRMVRLGLFPQMTVRDARLAAIQAKANSNAPWTPEVCQLHSDCDQHVIEAGDPQAVAQR